MTEPLSAAIVGAKILDILLGQAIGKGVDGLLGGASKALKDARSELDKETAQRAARMTLIVQQAAEEMQPALEQIKIDTGQDHSALFQHPPFLAQVAQALLTNLTLDVDAFRAEYQAKFGDSKWADLAEPLDMFFSQLKLLLARDAQWGPALREFRHMAQQANLNVSALQLVELSAKIAQNLDDLPERTAQAIQRPEQMRLEAWEKSYLRGLYAECNELLLASDAPPDVSRPAPRMQRVYVDLDVDQRLTLDRVLDRLRVPVAKRQAARNALAHLGPDAAGGRSWEGELSEEFTRSLARDLRQERLLGQEERTDQLKQLGIEPEALAQALKPVTAFEIIREHRQLVLLGDPGSGKSTLTRRIAGLLAAVEANAGQAERDQDWRSGLGGAFDHWHTPIRITLSRWAKRLPAKAGGVADELLDECLHMLAEAGNVGDDRLRTYLTDRLCCQPAEAVLLLDGLDEVTDGKRREKLIAAISDFCQTYPHVPLVVTCRARPYSEDASYRLPLPALTLAPLNDESVASFLQRWHDELVTARLYERGEAEQAQRRLVEAIGDRERSDLRRLADSPLQLTIMARVNYKQGLPGSRAMLYEMYVNELLYEWEKKKQGDKGTPTDLEKLLKEAGLAIDDLNRVLNKLAYDVHGQKGGRDTVDIPRQQLRNALEGLYLTKHQGQEAPAAAWAVQMLQFIDARSGLLRARQMGELYYFAHRTFQEYLAARWMASSDALQRIRQRIADPNWREVALLAFGYQIFKLEQPDSALLALHELMPEAVESETDRRLTLLLGEAYVRLLEPYRARQSAHQKAAGEVMAHMPILLRQAMQAGPLDDAARQNVRATARQRLDAGLLLADLDPAEPLMDDSVDIPGLGEIGRYPVTNREFKRFMDEGGYRQDKPWWSQKAKAELSPLLRSERPAPRYWDDSRFNHSTQPVVGISWYEAVAYCAWLTKKLQADNPNVEVRLPTLEEWRQVAGPLTYPWGNDFYPARANSEESGLGQTTPVDMYPDGATTPSGVWDMAGNVWEWTSTDDGDKKNPFYWRAGGAFWNDKQNIGSAARNRYVPWDRLGLLGFRVLVVPVSRSG